jgi:hypothetical protein
MLLNVLFSDVPIEFTAAIIAIEMPAAMRPYSMAVAPVSSFTKRRTNFLMGSPPLRYLVARAGKMWRSAFDHVNAITKNVDDAWAEYLRA